MKIVLSVLLLAAAATCSSPPQSSPPAPGMTGAPAADPVALGVTIDARDDRGAPRLIRAVVPRPSLAGTAPDRAARDHLAALAPLWVRTQPAVDLALTGVQRLRNGAAIVRLQQQIDQVVIRQGELRVMVHGDGSLAAVAGTLRRSRSPATFQSTPVAAVERALDARYGPSRVRPAITEAALRGGYQELSVAPIPGLAVHSARARRELLPDGDELIPIWAVELIADATQKDGAIESTARRTLIADADGRVVRDLDLTENDSFVYRAFAEPTGDRRPLDGALDSFTPHPTGVPDGSLPGPAPYNLVVMEAFNGPRDPWLSATATTTSGNNVDAFAQTAANGEPEGDIRPEVRAGRVLNHVYDFTADALATPTQSKAAAVNLFFVTNWLHDWYYDSGFTEVTGNAQVDNLGRGGIAGDPLIAHAQERAQDPRQRNSASMTTPADGLSPVMHMLLRRGGTSAHLTTPTAMLTAVEFLFGPHNFEVTGTAVLADDATGGTHEACGPVIDSVRGKIAIIDSFRRCSDAVIFDNLKAAGAIAVIVRDAFSGSRPFRRDGSATANLPGLILANEDGQALEAAAPVIVTLHRESTIDFDGAFDNAIIAHEWGHYLFRRLTSCETVQCGGMSEGWADFVALHMMLRNEDNRNGSFGVGLHALTAGEMTQLGAGDPGYFGLRRFPYSIDRTKNALSFRHISDGVALPDLPSNPLPIRAPNSQTHNAGEVWATMMWEAYNVLLDAHPFDEARRRMSDYTVAGMLLSPPDATYTEMRDAILAAAGALDDDDMLLMAAAFAGRGAGTCAASPRPASRDLTGVVESGTVAARLETSPPRVIDDGASCDHDGHLDPGETGTLRITVANSGVVVAEDVVVTATTTSPGVTLGTPIRLGSLAALTHVELAWPITAAPSAPSDARLDIAIAVDGDAGCNTRRVISELHRPMGVDEGVAVATRDGLETQSFAWSPTGGPGAPWRRIVDTTDNHALFGTDARVISDTQIVSPVLQVSPTEPLLVTARHSYDLGAIQSFLLLSGGVIELSSDSGVTWRDVTALGADPRYTGVLDTLLGNPLAGRPAFSATNPSFPASDPLTLDFGTQLAGQAVQLRFRLASGRCCAGAGWQLDDITVSGITNTPFPGFVAEPEVCEIANR